MQKHTNSQKILAMSNTKQIQSIILKWYDQHGRKTLPWQQDKTAYRVWVSEIMLQQTQVQTVIPYYQRFMERFPNLMTLALASDNEVLHLWTGLGYYTRARNLHRAAKMLLESYNSIFPDDVEELQLLPGIGRSTAGAIVALAYEKKATILDGNVRRVLARLHAIQTWPGEKETTASLWTIAENLTPNKRIADYTQAMMDIGATLCTRGTPKCGSCPLQPHCSAFQLGIAKQLPVSKPKKIIPIRQATLLMIMKNPHTILLEKRPPTGIWGGLWSLPEISGTPTYEEVKQECNQRFHYVVKDIQPGKIFRHTFSHFHLDIAPALISVRVTTRKLMEAESQIWYNLQEPSAIGLPAPVKKLLLELEK